MKYWNAPQRTPNILLGSASIIVASNILSIIPVSLSIIFRIILKTTTHKTYATPSQNIILNTLMIMKLSAEILITK